MTRGPLAHEEPPRRPRQQSEEENANPLRRPFTIHSGPIIRERDAVNRFQPFGGALVPCDASSFHLAHLPPPRRPTLPPDPTGSRESQTPSFGVIRSLGGQSQRL